jgi:hypothetical protein
MEAINTLGIELNNEEKEEAVRLLGLGVSGELAAQASKMGVTSASVMQALAEKGVTEATEEQIKQETLRQVLMKGNIVDKIKAIALSL